MNRVHFIMAAGSSVAVVCILVVMTVLPGYALVRAYTGVQSAKVSLNRAKTDLQKLDVATAKVEIVSAQQSLSDARDALQRVGFWRDVPGVGVHSVR